MSKYQETKKAYDALGIDQVLSALDEFNGNYLAAREQFIIGLTYLKRTGRYRESPSYKKSTFEDFLSARYGISVATFYQERQAFIDYEEEVRRIGLGTVRKVLTRVDGPKRRAVFEKIRSNTPLAKQSEIIEEAARPKPERPSPVARESATEIELKKQNLSLRNELAETKEQLKKAQAAAKYWKTAYFEKSNRPRNSVWKFGQRIRGRFDGPSASESRPEAQ